MYWTTYFFTEYLFFSKNKQKNLYGGGGGGGAGAGGGGVSRLYIVMNNKVQIMHN